jgi:hypothetical protein
MSVLSKLKAKIPVLFWAPFLQSAALLDRSPSSLRLGANCGVWFDLCLVSPSQDARTQGPLHMLVLAAKGRTTGQRVALVPAADDACRRPTMTASGSGAVCPGITATLSLGVQARAGYRLAP